MNALRDILKEKDMTSNELSDMTGIPLNTVRDDVKLEQINAERAVKYGFVLDCEPSEFNDVFSCLTVTYKE